MISMADVKMVSLKEIVGGGYTEFWRFKGRYRVCKGSRASKKSKTTALNLISRMMQYPDANLLVVRKTFNTLRDSCFKDLQWAANRLGVYHLWDFTISPLSATYVPTGQTIYFRGLDDPMKITSITVAKGYLCWLWVEEAYEVDSEDSFNMLDESIRGEIPKETGLFKQITLTFNPWSESHWMKARFFDADPDPDILAMTTNYMCNEWLDEADLKVFETMKEQNPTRYKVAGLGDWGIDGGQVFEEWIDDPNHYKDRYWTHVIDPFEIPKYWKVWRSFDFGYSKPFSVGWYTADPDGTIYRIRELYGCTGTPNEGVKWNPDKIGEEIHRIETEDPLLKGRRIMGVADPSIFDESRGESVAAMMERRYVWFEGADNHRIAGKMQCHYRLAFDENGVPQFYVFRTCKHFIRTIPLLKYDEKDVEDIDTDLEDHIYDEWRYMMMERPITPRQTVVLNKDTRDDPLNLYEDQKEADYDRYNFMRM